jgi:glucokinase
MEEMVQMESHQRVVLGQTVGLGVRGVLPIHTQMVALLQAAAEEELIGQGIQYPVVVVRTVKKLSLRRHSWGQQ